jgi:predicted transposase YdaD
MINLREADITQTRFYQQVLEIGRNEGITEGIQIGRNEGITEGIQIGRNEATQEAEANMVIRLLNRRCGTLSDALQNTVRSLSIPQLESLGEALLDFQDITDLENWLSE